MFAQTGIVHQSVGIPRIPSALPLNHHPILGYHLQHHALHPTIMFFLLILIRYIHSFVTKPVRSSLSHSEYKTGTLTVSTPKITDKMKRTFKMVKLAGHFRCLRMFGLFIDALYVATCKWLRR